MSRRWVLWIPLILLSLVAGFALRALIEPKDELVHSALVGKPLPAFTLPAAIDSMPGLDARNFATGKPRLLNIFASWCLPCQAEAPQLAALKKAGVEIEGVAVRDKPEDLAAFLAQYGNPYTRIGADQQMRIQVELGSSGVPETYLIGGDGKIIYQHIGDIREDDVPMLLAKLKAAR